MKRVGNLFNELCSFESLLQAYRKAHKAAGGSKTSLAFAFHLETELLRLRSELLSGSWKPQPYHYFTIYEPKERQISAAAFRDRIVHHALIQQIEPVFEPTFIYHSYATRKGKGVHAAREQAQQEVRKFPFFLKLDVESYFANMDHGVLIGLLAKKLKDPHLMNLLELIIRDPNPASKGLPIGNLTSQFFGNVYLNPLDHFIKQKLRCRGYIRYMDDLILFEREKAVLQDHLKQVNDFLTQILHLKLKSQVTSLGKSQMGLPFLGARIFASTIRMQRPNFQRSKKRLMLAIRKWKQGEITDETYAAILNGHVACLAQFDSEGLREELFLQAIAHKDEKF